MAFSYDHQDSNFSLTADDVFLSKFSTHMPLLPQQVGDVTNSPCFFYYSPTEVSAAETGAFDSNCCLGTSSTGAQTPSVSSQADHLPMLMAKHHTEMSTVQQENSFDRSDAQITSLTNKQCKDTKQKKNKKQKRSCGRDVKKNDERKLQNDDSKESKACKDASTGYIHVRARRGQATDSHSLAERVRREKISERMKMLQGLVPGCDKVTGKAHMLDEIINYVRSLQNQVEFLSMKLASFSPMLYDFGVELDECMNQTDHQQHATSAENTNHLNPRVIDSEATGYHMMDHSAPVLLQGQGPITFSQDVGSFMVQLAAQRQGLLNQLEFINMCSQ